jgi:hypothetical protein
MAASYKAHNWSHLNELNDASGSSGRQLEGGQPWGRQEAVSGMGPPVTSAMPGSRIREGAVSEVGDAGK